jgi:hypothetical protein
VRDRLVKERPEKALKSAVEARLQGKAGLVVPGAENGASRLKTGFAADYDTGRGG